MDRLERASLLLQGTRRALVGNRLAVIVPSPARSVVGSAADLAGAGVERLALADPTAVPAGRYAKAWLERIGLWAKVENRVVPTLNVRAALAAVAAGEADAGIVYLTDVGASGTVRLAFVVPEDEASRIVYPAAAIASSRRIDAARELLDFLASPPARAIFERFGFVALGSPAPNP